MEKILLNNFYLTKSMDICYITVLYITVAFFFAKMIETMFVFFYGEDHAQKTKNQLFIEIVIQVSISGLFSYIGRNIINKIPSPFHEMNGLDHYKIKELNSGAILLMFLIVFQKQLQKKIAILRDIM